MGGTLVGEVLVFFAEEVDEHGGVGHVEHTVVVEVACFQGHVAITQNRIDEGCYVFPTPSPFKSILPSLYFATVMPPLAASVNNFTANSGLYSSPFLSAQAFAQS